MDSAQGMAWAWCNRDTGMGCGYPDKLSHLKRAPTCSVTVSLGAASRKPQVEPGPTGGGGLELDESASTTTTKLSHHG